MTTTLTTTVSESALFCQSGSLWTPSPFKTVSFSLKNKKSRTINLKPAKTKNLKLTCYGVYSLWFVVVCVVVGSCRDQDRGGDLKCRKAQPCSFASFMSSAFW